MNMVQLRRLCDMYPEDSVVDLNMTIRFHIEGATGESKVVWPKPKLQAVSQAIYESCKELREALRIAMETMTLADVHTDDTRWTDYWLRTCACAGIKDGIGVRANEAIKKYEHEINPD